MEQRIILERDDGWRKYIHKFGRSNTEIVEYYKRQQVLLLDLLQRTQLEWLRINTSEISIEETVSQVLTFWNI
jgi:hypothetical protein